MIIEKTLGNISDYPIGDRKIEAILIDRYDLNKPHQKLHTRQGEVFAVSLEHGCNLEPGAVLYADDKRIVYLELTEENCIVIKPRGNIQWARAAFNIGNMHHAAYLHEDCIVTAYDAVLESVIAKLDVPYFCEVRRLEGIRANVAQGEGHHHHHHHHEDEM